MSAENCMINVAMHVHTLFSPCAESSIDDILMYCRDNNIQAIAITDHDSIAGAVELQQKADDLKVIVGEEIHTDSGEITGLFLKSKIEPGLSAMETCKRIKGQGGLVYIPHPFDPFKFHRLRRKSLLEILDLIDIIEVFNGKSNLPIFNKLAAKFAREHKKPGAAGSDAHYIPAIASCLNKMANFNTPKEFLANLQKAELIATHRYPLRTWWVGIKNVLKGEGHYVKRFGRSDR